MKFTIGLLALASFVAAIPAVVHQGNVTSPTPDVQGNVFVCVDANFQTACATFHGSSGQCVAFSSDFDNDISSFGPDSGQDCFIFVESDCTGRSTGPIRNPGVADLNTIGFNDVISSFSCFFG